MASDYSANAEALRKVFYDYELPLGLRLDAWAAWCKLYDAKQAEDSGRAAVCREHAL